MHRQSDRNSFIGKQAEEAVLQVLLDRGCTLVERNFNVARVGELDLIVMKNSHLFVVEVKSRRDQDSYGGSASAITPMKRMKMTRTTAIFLTERHLTGYDVVFLAGCVTHSDRGVITNVQILPF